MTLITINASSIAAPGNYILISAFYLNASSLVSINISVKMHYPCSINPNYVNVLYLENGTWIPVTFSMASAASCIIIFDAPNRHEMGIFEYVPAAHKAYVVPLIYPLAAALIAVIMLPIYLYTRKRRNRHK